MSEDVREEGVEEDVERPVRVELKEADDRLELLPEAPRAPGTDVGR